MYAQGRRVVLVRPCTVILLPPWAQRVVDALKEKDLSEEEAIRLIFAYGAQALAEGLKELERLGSSSPILTARGHSGVL